jgi:hypothetical protein
MHECFYSYSIADLKSSCHQYMSTSGAKTRTEIYRLISEAPARTQACIRRIIVDCMQDGRRKYARESPLGQGIHHGTPAVHQRAREDDEGDENTPSTQDSLIDDILCENAFMAPPSKRAVDDAKAQFIDRTNNAALAMGACAVCARETARSELQPTMLDCIPNSHRLAPSSSHPAHDIYNGMLLHPVGISNSGKADMCIECMRALKADTLPMFALANGLWIGRVPHELAYLTLPERMLIAKYFPAAYIIKLYPKKKGARKWD